MLPKNLGAYIKGLAGLAWALVAAAGSDNAAKTTDVIDRKGYLSGVLEIPWNATAVTDTKTLSIGVRRFQSADNSAWDAAEVILAPTVVFTAANPTLAGTGTVEIDQDLSACKRYVKYEVTADLSHTSVDTACYGCVFILGGADTAPVT